MRMTEQEFLAKRREIAQAKRDVKKAKVDVADLDGQLEEARRIQASHELHVEELQRELLAGV